MLHECTIRGTMHLELLDHQACLPSALLDDSIPLRRRQWHPTPVLLPGKSHGWRSLVGCSPWGHKESDAYWPTSLSPSCIGEGKGNPPQCSCLENPRDGGAWRAAVCGVAQSWTRLKRLSSSSSSSSSSSNSFSYELVYSLLYTRAHVCVTL